MDNNYTHTIIFLHGFTMKSEEMIYFKNKINTILKDKKDKNKLRIKYIFPQAPKRKISCYNGKIYTAWFDYLSENIFTEEEINSTHLFSSCDKIHKLIDKEVLYHNDPKKVFIGGYSQGCGMALTAGLTYSKKLGGIIGFKGIIHKETYLKKIYKQNIWVTNGKKDKTIGYDIVNKLYNDLIKKGYKLTFLSQENVNHGMRSGIIEQMVSLKSWLNKLL